MTGDREGREYRRSGFHGPPDGGARRDEPLGYRHDEHSRDRGGALFRRPSFDQGFNPPMGRPGSHYMPQRYSPDRSRPYSPDRAPGRYASERHLSPPSYRRDDPFGRSRFDREPPPPPPPPPPREHLRDGAWSSYHDRRGSGGAQRSRESSPHLHYGSADELHHSMPVRSFDVRQRRLSERASADGEAVSPTAAATGSRGGAGNSLGRSSQPAADDHRHNARLRALDDGIGSTGRSDGPAGYDASNSTGARDGKSAPPVYGSAPSRQSAWDPKPVVPLGLVASLKEAASKQGGTGPGSSGSHRHHHASSGAAAQGGSGLPPPPPPPHGVFSNLGAATVHLMSDEPYTDTKSGFRTSSGGFDRPRLPPPPLSLPPHMQQQQQQAGPLTPHDEPLQIATTSLGQTPSTAGLPITSLTPSSTAPSTDWASPPSAASDGPLKSSDYQALQPASEAAHGTGAGSIVNASMLAPAGPIHSLSAPSPHIPASVASALPLDGPSVTVPGRWSSTPGSGFTTGTAPFSRLSAWDAPVREPKTTVSSSGVSSLWDVPAIDTKASTGWPAPAVSLASIMPASPTQPVGPSLAGGTVASSTQQQMPQLPPAAAAADKPFAIVQDTNTTTPVDGHTAAPSCITSAGSASAFSEVKSEQPVATPAAAAAATLTAPPVGPLPLPAAIPSTLSSHGAGHATSLSVSFQLPHSTSAALTGQKSGATTASLDKANTILSTIASTVSVPAKAAATAGASAQQQQQQGRSRRFGMGISRRGSIVVKGGKDGGDVDSAEKASKDGEGQGPMEEDVAHAADQAAAAMALGSDSAAADSRRPSLAGGPEDLDSMDVDVPRAVSSEAASPRPHVPPLTLSADVPLTGLKPLAVVQQPGMNIDMQDAGTPGPEPSTYAGGMALQPGESPISPPTVSETQRMEYAAQLEALASAAVDANSLAAACILPQSAVTSVEPPPQTSVDDFSRPPPGGLLQTPGSNLVEPINASAPSQPSPPQPTLLQPSPTQSIPLQPAPSEPIPLQPAPTEPASIQPASLDAIPAASTVDARTAGTALASPKPTAAEITAQLEVVEAQIGEVEGLLQQLPEEQTQVDAALVEVETKLAALDQALLEDQSSELSQVPSSPASSSSSSSSSSEEGAGERPEAGLEENGAHASSTAPSLNSNGQGARVVASVTAVHVITAAPEVQVKPPVAEAPLPSESTSESESQEPTRPATYGRGRGRGRGGRGRGRGRGAAVAKHQRLLLQQAAAAVVQQQDQEGEETSDSSHIDLGPAYPSKNEVVSFMQLSSRQTEKLLLEGGQNVARQNWDLVLALLPPEMAAQVRASLEPGGPPFQPVVTEPSQLPAWEANEEAFQAAKPGMLRFMRERRQLLAAKQAALEQRYHQHLSALKAELSAIKKERPPPTPSFTPMSARSSSSRHLGSMSGAASFGVVRSDYEEQIILENLQAEEQLKTMSVLPEQELDLWYKRWQGFDDCNGIRPDPEQELAEGRVLGHWSEAERKAFMELFLQFPKDFTRIAQHLPGRSTGDCVAFFYKHQKLDEFANVRRKQQLKKRKMNCDAKRHMMMMISPMMARARGFHLPMGDAGPGHPGYPPPGLRAVLPPLPQQVPPATGTGRGARGRGRGGGRNQGGARAAGGYDAGSQSAPHQMQAVPGVIGMGIPPTLTAVPPAHIPPVQYSLYRGVSNADDLASNGSLVAPPPPSLHGSDSQTELLAAPPPPPVAAPDGRMSTANTPSDSAFVHAVRLHGRDFRTISRQLGMRSESTAKQFYYKHRHRLDLDSALEHFNRTAETAINGHAASDRSIDHLTETGPLLPSVTTALNSPMSASLSIGPTISGVGLGMSNPGSFSNLTNMGFNLPGAPKGILPPFTLPPVSSGTPTADGASGLAVPQVAPPLDVVGIGLHASAGEATASMLGRAAMEEDAKETVTTSMAAASGQQMSGGLNKRPSGGRSAGRGAQGTQQVDSAAQLLAQLQREVLGHVPLFNHQLQQPTDSGQLNSASSTPMHASASTPSHATHGSVAPAVAASALPGANAQSLHALMNQLNSYQTHQGPQLTHGGVLTAAGNATSISLPPYLQLLRTQGPSQPATGIPLQAVTALPMAGSGHHQNVYLVGGGGLIAAPGMQAAGTMPGQNSAANQLIQALQLLYKQPAQPQPPQHVQLQVSQLLLNHVGGPTQVRVAAAQPLQQQQQHTAPQLGALLTSLQNQAAASAATTAAEPSQWKQPSPAPQSVGNTQLHADGGQQFGPGSTRTSGSGSDSKGSGAPPEAAGAESERLKGAGPEARGRSRDGQPGEGSHGQDLQDGKVVKKARTEEDSAASAQQDVTQTKQAAKLQSQRNSNASELSNPASQTQPPHPSSIAVEQATATAPTQQQQVQLQLHPFTAWFQQQQQQQQQQLPLDLQGVLPEGLANLLAAQQQQPQMSVLSVGNGGLMPGASIAAAAAGGPVVAMPGAPAAPGPTTQQGSQLLFSLQQQANEASMSAAGLSATGSSVISAPALLLQQLGMPQAAPSQPVLHVQQQLDGSAVLLSMLGGSMGRPQQAMLPNNLGVPMELRGHSLSPAPLLLSSNGQLLTQPNNMVGVGAAPQDVPHAASAASIGDVQQVIGVLDALDKAAAAPGGLNAALLEELKGSATATGSQGNRWHSAAGTTSNAVGVSQSNGMPGSQANLLLLPVASSSGGPLLMTGRPSQMGSGQPEVLGMAAPPALAGKLPADAGGMPQAVLQLLAQQAGVTAPPLWQGQRMSDQQGEVAGGSVDVRSQPDKDGSRRSSRQPSPSPQLGCDANGMIQRPPGLTYARMAMDTSAAPVQMVLLPAGMDSNQLQSQLQGQLQGQQLLSGEALPGSWGMSAVQAAGVTASQPDAPSAAAVSVPAHTSVPEQQAGQTAGSPMPDSGSAAHQQT